MKPTLDSRQLLAFSALARRGSFTLAAKDLFLTQSAVSHAIKSLEDDVGCRLLDRVGRRVLLTQAGEQFLRFATTLVQVWDRARRAVALPPGRETVVTIGAELSLWSPLLRHWLLWMRRECPEIAVRTQIATSEQLMEQVQDGTLDVAVLYAAPSRPGVIAELLFEEKLVLVRTTPTTRPLAPEDHVQIDWGEDFAASYQAAFPDQPNAVVSISYGPLALDYILATGGSGYFRKGFIRSYLEEGRLALVPGSPSVARFKAASPYARAGSGRACM